ncbi:Uncharacterised protein [BD1-7 clade bacterium]|uniref:Uncharacterized protein n=1 Tax=BD1-7 clade bacterium TaxID=2029982 RepID=A0A5S9NQI0_9GAMM|nr:Uncharacterised protein [BD1-7 clade bacterium]
MTNDVYDSPQFDSDKGCAHRETIKSLKNEQSILGVSLGMLLGLIPSLTFLYVYNQSGQFPYLLMVVPGIVIAFAVRFCGRPYDLGIRVVPAVILAVLLAALFFALDVSPIAYPLTFVNGMIVVGFSRRTLNMEQERALYALRNGKVNL